MSSYTGSGWWGMSNDTSGTMTVNVTVVPQPDYRAADAVFARWSMAVLRHLYEGAIAHGFGICMQDHAIVLSAEETAMACYFELLRRWGATV